MALETASLEGVVLLRDSHPLCGEPVLFSLAKSSARICIITQKGRKSVLSRRYPTKVNESTSFVYITPETSLETVNKSIPADTDFCILDGIDMFIELFSVDKIASMLHSFRSFRCVAALCPESVVSSLEWARLSSVADATFSLYRQEGANYSKSLVYKKNGKTINMVEVFTVGPDLKLTSRKYDPAVEEKTKQPPTEDPYAPFDIGLTLKDTERAARDALQLPYMSTENQEGLVNLRLSDKKVRVGGQVIYTPDEGDDLDDSDPDDDLNL